MMADDKYQTTPKNLLFPFVGDRLSGFPHQPTFYVFLLLQIESQMGFLPIKCKKAIRRTNYLFKRRTKMAEIEKKSKNSHTKKRVKHILIN